MGDTNRFLNPNLSVQVFDIAKILFEKKADIEFVYENMYRSINERHIRAYQYFAKNLKIVENGQVAYIVFDVNTFKKLKLDHEDVKFCVDEMNSLKGVKVCFLCMGYEKDFYRISMRSKKGFNTIICSAANGGGGHMCASAFDKKIKKSEMDKFIKYWGKEVVNGK